MNTTGPVDLYIDNDLLYWTDQSDGSIKRILINNTYDIETVLEGLGHPVGIAVSDNLIFWSNNSNGQIFRTNLYTQRTHTMYTNRGNGYPKGMTVVSSVSKGIPIQCVDCMYGVIGDQSSCSDNDMCSHMCIPLANGYYQCACPDNILTECHEYGQYMY